MTASLKMYSRSCVCLAAATWGIAAAADTPFEEVRRAARQSLGKSRDQREREGLQEIQAIALRLSEQYGRLSTGEKSVPFSELYIRSLAANTGTLRSLPRVASERESAVTEIRDDMRLKLRYAQSSLSFAGGFPSVVKVTVETVRAGKPVEDLWVRCNPRRYGVTKNPQFVFNSASSPTVSNLPPGKFILWVENAAKESLVNQPVDIGEKGVESETIRISIP